MLLWLKRLGFEFPDRVSRLTQFAEPDFLDATVSSFEGIFVDIGAGAGAYVLIAKKATCIIAFEPDPRFWPQLEKISATMPCTIRHEVISDRSGVVPFNLSSSLFGSRIGTPKKGIHRQQVVTKSITLDSIELGTGPVLVKMDTEGAEHLIIRGGMEFIKKYHPKLLIEYHGNLRQVLHDLMSLGYSYQGRLGWRDHGWIMAEPKSPARIELSAT